MPDPTPDPRTAAETLARDRADHRRQLPAKLADLTGAAGDVDPAAITEAATAKLAAAGIAAGQAGALAADLLHLLRGTIAPQITRHLIPCRKHPRVPAWQTCPNCAYNTALIRASRVAQGANVPDPLTTWPSATKKRPGGRR